MSQGVRKGATYALLGQGVASIFLFLFQIFAGRWLGVESYGLLNVLYSSIFIVSVLIISGIVQGLIRYIAYFEVKGDDTGIKQTIQISFIVYIIFLFIIIILSLIFKTTLLNKLFNLEITILLQYLIGLFGLSLFRFYLGILQGYRKFHIFSFGIGIKEFIMFIILVLIVKIMRLSAIEVGWSIAVSPFIALLFIWRTVKNNHTILNWNKDSSLNIQIIKFILMTGLIALMNQWVIRAGPLILKIIGGDKADYNAGLFSAIIMPLNLARTVVVALLTGLYPNLSRAYSMKNDNLIRRYIMRSAGIVAIIIIFIIPVFYFTGPQIVKLLYGQDYIAPRSDTFLLSLVVSFFILGMLFSKIIMARGTPKYSAISFFIGIIGLISVLIWVDLPPLKLVEVGLLICNFLYASIQIAYLFIIKLKRHLENQKFKDRLS